MIVIAWDVGIKNLSFACIDYFSLTKWKILSWMLIDTLIGTNDTSVFKMEKVLVKLAQYKDKILPNDLDKVVIESQQGSKQVMRMIQTTILTYYLMHGIQAKNIRVMRSSAKFSLDPKLKMPRGKKQYSKRKKMSVEICLKCLNDIGDYRGIKFLTDAKKSDDLSDALTMALKECGYIIPRS